jgi:GT2 family glycosyltransferase
MLPEYLLKNITALSDNKIVMAAKYNTDINLRIKNGPVIQNGGAMTIPVKIIKAVGGFAHYRCAIDTDLMDRAKMAGFGIEPIPQALYLRRVHPKALTRRADTGMGSDYRKKSWAEMTAARERGIIKIKPVTVKLEEVR